VNEKHDSYNSANTKLYILKLKSIYGDNAHQTSLSCKSSQRVRKNTEN